MVLLQTFIQFVAWFSPDEVSLFNLLGIKMGPGDGSLMQEGRDLAHPTCEVASESTHIKPSHRCQRGVGEVAHEGRHLLGNHEDLSSTHRARVKSRVHRATSATSALCWGRGTQEDPGDFLAILA